MRRQLLAVLVILGTCLAGTAPALAAWAVGSSAAVATAAATSLQPPSLGAPTTTGSSVTLTWTAPGTGAAPSGYTVHRTAPTTAPVCVAVAATTCTDSGLSPTTTYTYAVTSLLGPWASSAATTSATTATPLPSAFLVTVPATAQAGTPFSVTIQARQSDGTNDSTYTGNHALTFTGPGTVGGYAPVYPATASFNASGFATVSVTLYKAESVTLTVDDGTPSRTGVSGLVAVAPRPGIRLRWTSDAAGLVDACPVGTVVVGANGQRSLYVGVLDTYGNRAIEPAGRDVTISRPGGGGADAGTFSVTTLPIPAGANPAVTTGTVTLKLKKKTPADTTFRASSAGLARVDCTLTVS